METQTKTSPQMVEATIITTPDSVFRSPYLNPVNSATISENSSAWKWVALLLLAIIVSTAIFSTILFCCYIVSFNQQQSIYQNPASTVLQCIQSKSGDGSIPKVLQCRQIRISTETEVLDQYLDVNSKASEFREQEINPDVELLELVATRAPDEKSCPVCPPCHPEEGIPTNKDPISLVNMLYSKAATYTCKTVCLEPNIHIATLQIASHSDKWTGKATTKKEAKKKAAYEALLVLNQTLAEESGFISVPFNPKCSVSNLEIEDILKENERKC